jgi:hypothetical protein
MDTRLILLACTAGAPQYNGEDDCTQTWHTDGDGFGSEKVYDRMYTKASSSTEPTATTAMPHSTPMRRNGATASTRTATATWTRTS